MKHLFLLLTFMAVSCFGTVSNTPVGMDVSSDGSAIIYTSPPIYGGFDRGRNELEWHTSTGEYTIDILSEIDGASYLIWLSRTFTSGSPFAPTDLGDELIQWLESLTEPSAVTDASTNLVDAVLVNSVCATFDGTADIIELGDVWSTQEPHVKCKINIGALSAIDRRILERKGLVASNQEYGLRMMADETVLFEIWDGSTNTTSVRTAAALDILTWYDVEGWYNRVAGSIHIRYRVSETESWTTANNGSAGSSVVFSGADATAIGGVAWGAGYKWNGQIADVQIWDYATTTQLNGYPLNEASGTSVYDTVGTEDGVVTVGAGGEATFWGSRQDVFHDAAIRGASKVFVLDDNTSVSLTGTSASTGTKSLSVRAKPTTAANQTIFFSDGKSLIFDFVSGSAFDVIYDASTIGSATLDTWSTITTDVTLDSGIQWGGGACHIEIASMSIEDNGSWDASAFDGTTAYNIDQSGSLPDLADNGVEVRQYPANEALTDDVDGVGLINPASGAGLNGGIHQVREVGEILPNFNGTTSFISLPTTAGVTQYPHVQAFVKPRSSGTQQIFYKRQGSAIAYEFRLNNGKPQVYTKAWEQFTMTLAIPYGEWSEVKFEYDYDNSKIFLSSRLHGVEAWTTDEFTGVTAFTPDARPTNIGAGADWLGAEFFDGEIADVRIFDYSDGTPLHRWKLWDITGDTAPDSVGSDTGTSTNLTPDTASIIAGDKPLADNGFWDLNGFFSTKSYSDALLHQPFDLNVVTKYNSSCGLDDAITFDELTGDEYDDMVTWLSTVSCGGATHEPLEDTNSNWVLDVNGHVSFPAIP
jgi:hypothetical protein|tara:strand:- start:2146 stop:4587 length:2442 start_codon:yes stop_codon:yes gene_type:complete